MKEWDDSKKTVICFPHAGAHSNAYVLWSKYFGPNFRVVTVDYPKNINDGDSWKWKTLIDNLLKKLSSEMKDSYILFGHSMGAMICYELTRLISQSKLPLPKHLFLSSCRAPHLGLFESNQPSFRKITDLQLLEQLVSLQGIPSYYLNHAELLQDWLPEVRRHLVFCEGYSYRPGSSIHVPMTVFGGTSDPLVDKKSLKAWRVHTNESFQSFFLPGNHFYFHNQPLKLIDKMKRVLQ